MEDKNKSEKRCVACQGKLQLVVDDVYLRFDTPFQFFQDGLSMDVYECENCRRLEFYSSVSENPLQAEKDDLIVCPECGKEHSKYISCPHCLAEKGFKSFRKVEADKVRKSRRRKNAVPWEL